MTDMQKTLLEMFKWLTDFLEKNSISYYAVGGTLLGAIRHKGFIPWDDDIDIALPRKDYLKFISLMGTDIIDGYRLESPYEGNKDFLYTYSKLYDTRTTLIERQKKNIKRGVFIDVFPLDGAGNTIDDAKKKFRAVNRKNMFLMTRTCAIRKERKWIKNLFIMISRCIPFVNDKKCSLKVDAIMSKTSYEESLFVSNFSGSYGEKELVEKRLFGEPTDYPFETITVKGPAYYDEYLTGIYGNWRKMPPVEKRGVQHDFLYVDLNKSYLS